MQVVCLVAKWWKLVVFSSILFIHVENIWKLVYVCKNWNKFLYENNVYLEIVVSCIKAQSITQSCGDQLLNVPLLFLLFVEWEAGWGGSVECDRAVHSLRRCAAGSHRRVRARRSDVGFWSCGAHVHDRGLSAVTPNSAQPYILLYISVYKCLLIFI